MMSSRESEHVVYTTKILRWQLFSKKRVGKLGYRVDKTGTARGCEEVRMGMERKKGCCSRRRRGRLDGTGGE